MTFNHLGLSAELLRAVSEQGYSKPTPIQSQAIPVVLKGGDLLAAAQTGTGKTAGFTLPLLQRLGAIQSGKDKRPVRALVLTPTRELAAQVSENVRAYSRYLSLRSTVIFGGVSIRPQIKSLHKGVDVLVATPGRLLDHISQKTLDLSQVEILVLDEADRMLDMGFIRDIRKIMALLPKQRQTLLFSATFSSTIKKLADSLLNNPSVVEVARNNAPAEAVNQAVHLVDKAQKRALLAHLITANNWNQVLVFTRTKHGANRLAEQLSKAGITSSAIHGNKSQGARTKALDNFKKGCVRVLVATDIAARGIDIEQLPQVVNFELPNAAADYVHRIGRTGRAGCKGEALSLVSGEELTLLKDIEKLLKHQLKRISVAGFAPAPNLVARSTEMKNTSQPGKKGNHKGKPKNVKTNGSRKTVNRQSRRYKGNKLKDHQMATSN